MDGWIVGLAIGGFALFIVVHVALCRVAPHHQAVRTFFVALAVTSTLVVALAWRAAGWEAAVISWLLFTLISCSYFMGIFGLMATSVRIRLLIEIARAGGNGITMNQLLKRYNREVIVRQRLARFVASGDIIVTGGRYRAGGVVTFFALPALILATLKRLI